MIKQSVINSFNRVGIDYKRLIDDKEKHFVARNRFTGEEVKTTILISYLINWVYQTNDEYERGNCNVRLDDFDRIRYFVLEQDQNAYMTCLD